MSSGGRSEIKVPALGESIREATVARWLKSVGDPVKVDEVLVELETDKVTLEVGAPASGILTQAFAGKGVTVFVGDVLGFVGEGGPVSQEGKSQPAGQQPKKQRKKQASQQKAAVVEAFPPSVRKLAEELSLNPTDLQGTGKGGRLTKEDVINFAERKTGVVEQPIPAHRESPTVNPPRGEPVQGSSEAILHSIRTSDHREERVKMTRLRQRIAERLKYAQNTAAILTTFNEVDMHAINAIRSEYKESFEKKHGVRLGVMSFFVKACVQALKEFPAVNAEIEGDEIIYKNYYDIGVAVSTPQGLVVPVVRDADVLTFAEVEKSIAALAQKARDGKLSIAEMTGGTFTISNGGVFGSLLATPILNPPQTGILGMHKIEDRPVVVHGKIEIRPMMYVALSYDHRVIDGRESVTFLVKVKENLENPERLLLDM
jgi:2-oxoglutarate dehydrogenase E2 component (dihydrolipoamide succinyltransferase)